MNSSNLLNDYLVSIKFIKFVDGAIVIQTKYDFIRITELNQVYFFNEQIKYYRLKCHDEKTLHVYNGIFDLFSIARREFILHKELKCIKNLWLTQGFVANMQS